MPVFCPPLTSWSRAATSRKPVLVGKVEDVKAAAEKGGFCIDGAQIIDPETYEDMDNMAQTMFDLRKGQDGHGHRQGQP